MFEQVTCLLCRQACKQITIVGGFEFECRTCGTYRTTFEVAVSYDAPERERNRVSCILRERETSGSPVVTFFLELPTTEVSVPRPYMDIYNVTATFPRSLSERFDRALMNLARLSEYPGDTVGLTADNDYPLFFIDTSPGRYHAWRFLLEQLEEQRLVTYQPYGEGVIGATLTADGWQRVYELERGNEAKSRRAFIAMSFKPELSDVSIKIHQAISDAGYDPFRVDDEDHNDVINDKIIAGIRASKFVVCDFSRQSNGVYFEAGFAKGLGLPVIWCCEEAEVNGLHFDTHQYNHILWTNAEDFYEKLYNRIKATIV